MNKFPNSFTRMLPVAAGLLMITAALTLSGCGGGPSEPPINEDSVRPHAISIKEAAALCSNFRSTTDTLKVKCPQFKDAMYMGYAEAFNRDTYRILLRQKDSTGALAAGIRIYYGLDAKGVMKLVMVPYDQYGNDILHHLISTDVKPLPGDSSKERKAESLTVDGAQAMEQGSLCPTVCTPTGPLMPQ
jgi:hypothetical protein